MKLKTLRKKIRRLEARLQEGAKKLAKLKQKLAVTTTADAKKAKKKSDARQPAKAATAIRKKKRRSTVKSQVKRATAPKPVPAKAKRKLNLSPERRAQLAAAMKARWAAKRAAAETGPQEEAPSNRDFTLGQAPQTP